MNYNKKTIEQALEGYWYREPSEDWYANNIDINKQSTKRFSQQGYKVLFIAMDTETWDRGTQNIGSFGIWQDTHKNLHDFQPYISGVIAARPIEYLDDSIPQFIVENSYNAIKYLAKFSYDHFEGKMIGITGSAGKSTTKSMLQSLLSIDHEVTATKGNHNSRTGVPITVACGITNPDYMVVEAAISSLWMKAGGVMKTYVPDIAMITSIGSTHQRDIHQTAILKSRIAEGMNNQGTVVLNRDMNEFETVYQTVSQYNKNIIIYGFHEESHSFIKSFEETRDSSRITANILGEEIKVTTQLSGKAMAQNVVGVLTIVKLLDIPLSSVLEKLKSYQPNKGVQNIKSHQTHKGTNYTVINDSWNAVGISMIEGIETLNYKSQFYKGRKIAALGRLMDLKKEEIKPQHEAIAKVLIDNNIDLVFGYGEEIKYTLKQLPKQMVAGYYDDHEELAKEVSNIIEEDDLILLKGSTSGGKFPKVNDRLVYYSQNFIKPTRSSNPIPSDGYGVATFKVSTGEKVSSIGRQDVVQNQGVGSLLLINRILNMTFAKKVQLSDLFEADNQSIKESKNPRSIPLNSGDKLKLDTILSAAIVTASPNAILMLANKVVGSNKDSMNQIKNEVKSLGMKPETALNITSRRISHVKQELTLDDLFKVSQILFNKYPFIKDLLGRTSYSFKDQYYKTESNLFSYGLISHGLFYGQGNSIGTVLSKIDGEEYITVVLGAKDAFHRDALIANSIKKINEKDEYKEEIEEYKINNNGNPVKINIIGDTYFGEFYTNIRKRQGKDDALATEGRNYSFDKIRPLISEEDFNICNFEAAISNDDNQYLKQRKPFVLHASEEHTVHALKQEGIQLVTLANNHLMDCGIKGLKNTVKSFNDALISTIGADTNQEKAERPFIINKDGEKIAIFNAYWYRRPMYREFDFYAIGDEPGVACINPMMFEKIKECKEKYAMKVIVICHWGVDFQRTSTKQREYARSISEAGADLIIGHGAHLMQSIERIGTTTVVYSIGNGVFNSNGEYDKRFVPPYSFIAQLELHYNNNSKLKLYPIYGNNLETYWQPRFLTENEANHCHAQLKQMGAISKMTLKKDDQYYFELPVNI